MVYRKTSSVTETITNVPNLTYSKNCETCSDLTSSLSLKKLEQQLDGNGISKLEVEKLKEHIRLCKGLPLINEVPRKHIDFLKPPYPHPRSNYTHKRRIERQQYQMVKNLECLKEKYKQYIENDEQEDIRKLLELAAKTKTCVGIKYDNEFEDLMNLKKLATIAKNHQSEDYRSNRNIELRLKALRREPIITEHFKNAFNQYGKAPFIVPKKYEYPKAYQVPKINRKKEVWYHPFDDYVDSVPLQYQQNLQPIDKRSQKEKARPPLRPGKRTLRWDWNFNKIGMKNKPPWNYFGNKSFNSVL
ncbi:hypothetical protein PGB90_000019 [Kerria lacca]